jgi:hypothetical protein
MREQRSASRQMSALKSSKAKNEDMSLLISTNFHNLMKNDAFFNELYFRNCFKFPGFCAYVPLEVIL